MKPEEIEQIVKRDLPRWKVAEVPINTKSEPADAKTPTIEEMKRKYFGENKLDLEG